MTPSGGGKGQTLKARLVSGLPGPGGGATGEGERTAWARVGLLQGQIGVKPPKTDLNIWLSENVNSRGSVLCLNPTHVTL